MMDHGWWMWGGRSMPHWGMGGGILLLLLLLVLLGLVIWLVVRSARSQPARPVGMTVPPASSGPDPVLQTLRQRLAAGEITAQEFDELRAKLGV